MLGEFEKELIRAELSERTIKKYVKDTSNLLNYLGEKTSFESEFSKENLLEYKKELMLKYKVSSINSKIVSINRFTDWAGLKGFKLKTERLPKKISMENVISKREYNQLLEWASANGHEKYYLIMRVLASTGIRVGELKYITKEAVKSGSILIRHKNRNRAIYIPDETQYILHNYCDKNNIESGIIFHGKDKSKPIDESTIWKMLKRIAGYTHIDKEKVYPHSFRHLFAKVYMNEIGNLAELADILGHSSIETTRIYTLTTSSERRKSIGRLGL